MTAASMCLAAALVQPVRATAAPPAAAFTATYALRSGSMKIGVMTRQLSFTDGGQYRFEARMESSGLLTLFRDAHIDEISAGSLDDRDFKPEHYEYRRVGGQKDRLTTIHFDWVSGVITTTVQGDSWRMPAVPKTLDKLVYQLALMRDLSDGTRPLTYAIADGGKIKQYALNIVGEELVRVNGAEVPAVKVEYVREDSKRRTTLWCAPSYRHLPIRIEYREKDGRVTTAELTEFR